MFTYKQDIAPKFENGSYPFGYEYGYKTNAGIISVTSTVHHGYTWNGEEGWILHAQLPRNKEKENKLDFKKKGKRKKMPHQP